MSIDHYTSDDDYQYDKAIQEEEVEQVICAYRILKRKLLCMLVSSNNVEEYRSKRGTPTYQGRERMKSTGHKITRVWQYRP